MNILAQDEEKVLSAIKNIGSDELESHLKNVVQESFGQFIGQSVSHLYTMSRVIAASIDHEISKILELHNCKAEDIASMSYFHDGKYCINLWFKDKLAKALEYDISEADYVMTINVLRKEYMYKYNEIKHEII